MRDMFVGLAPTLARDLPFSGLYVVFYRFFKDQATHSNASSDLVAGLAAGLISTFFTHPFDVMKTRAQIGSMKLSWGKELWSGLSLRLVKRPLSTALTWASYEALCRLSDDSNI